MPDFRYILSIESAVARGSISVIHNGTPLIGTSHDEHITRAEDLLLQVDRILQGAELHKSFIDAVAVSIGPGSFTGLRIGISTALGLAAALRKPCIRVPLLQAVASEVETDSESVVAIPLGRSELCYQQFRGEQPLDDHIVSGYEDLRNALFDSSLSCFVHEDIDVDMLSKAFSSSIRMVNIGSNLAEYVGLYAFKHKTIPFEQAIYVQNPRFR